MEKSKRFAFFAVLIGLFCLLSSCGLTGYVKEKIDDYQEKRKEDKIREQKIEKLPLYDEVTTVDLKKELDPLVDKYDQALKKARDIFNESIGNFILDHEELRNILAAYQDALQKSKEVVRIAGLYDLGKEYMEKYLVPESERRLYNLIIIGSREEIEGGIAKANNGIKVLVISKMPFRYDFKLSEDIYHER